MTPLLPIEDLAIADFRTGEPIEFPNAKKPSTDDWIYFGLTVLLWIGTMVRGSRHAPMGELVNFKQDGSPVTQKENDIEIFVRRELAEYYPDARICGEESGGRLSAYGISVAIDPIDGTWAFINRTENFATSLVFFRDRKPFLAMVMNPSTGELGYASGSRQTRLLQLSVFGEGDLGYDLPLDRVPSGSKLINVHPQKNADALLNPMFREWRKKGVNMVRMPGGSPAFALLEAAKGSFTYVNLWAKAPAAPYDLAAGVSLVRNAGGDVVDLSGEPVNSLDNSGPFVAGLNGPTRDRMVHIVRQALGDSM